MEPKSGEYGIPRDTRLNNFYLYSEMSSADSAEFDTAETGDDFESFDTDEASLEMESTSRSSSPASAKAVIKTDASPPALQAPGALDSTLLHAAPRRAAVRGLPLHAGVHEHRPPRSRDDDPMRTFDARFAGILLAAEQQTTAEACR